MRSSWLLLILLYATPVRAGEADDLLLKIDGAVASTRDKVWQVNMRVIATDGDVHEARMLMLQGGSDKRILRFLAPANMRNTALMATTTREFYVFLGGESRVRRLGSSALTQTFLGSDFVFEDLGDIAFHLHYAAKIVGRQGDDTIVQLDPKDASGSWSKLVLWAEPHGLLRRIEYYDRAGAHVRTQTRTFERGKSQYETWVPRRILMVNERTKHATELSVEVADAEHGIPEEVFSLRGLQRGDDLRYAP